MILAPRTFPLAHDVARGSSQGDACKAELKLAGRLGVVYERARTHTRGLRYLSSQEEGGLRSVGVAGVGEIGPSPPAPPVAILRNVSAGGISRDARGGFFCERKGFRITLF